jgi:hypothetical protein
MIETVVTFVTTHPLTSILGVAFTVVLAIGVRGLITQNEVLAD